MTASSASPTGAKDRSARSAASTLVSKLLRLGGIDRTLAYGVAQQVWSLGTGPVALLLIALRFTPVTQGYYYTFNSLIALQVLAEAGLGQVIIQFASHEWAKLGLDNLGKPTGDAAALSRLISLGRFGWTWYLVASVLMFLIVAPAGLLFFRYSTQTSAPGAGWLGPWLALCLLSSVSMCFIPAWSILVGCNQVRGVYRFRLLEDIFVSLALWASILIGANLWVPVICSLVKLVYNCWTLTRSYGSFFSVFLVRPSGPRICWREELLGLQWRFAVSWLAGYLSFSLFTPLAFHYLGPRLAGQMGMTWALLYALFAVASTWVSSNVPTLGMLVAQKKFDELDALTFRCGAGAVIVALVGGCFMWLVVYALGAVHDRVQMGLLPAHGVWLVFSRLASRLLPPLPSGLFILATIVLVSTLPLSAYLRAHKREPLMGLSVVQGLLNAVALWWVSSDFGATGMAIAYLVVIAGIVLPASIVIWRRCREEWHSDASESLQSCPAESLGLFGNIRN